MSVAGWKPAPAEALVELERGGGDDDGDEHRGAGTPDARTQRTATAASTAPVMMRVGEVVARRRDARRRSRRASVRPRCRARTPRRAAAPLRATRAWCACGAAAAAARADLGGEELVVVDVGHVDERADRRCLVVPELARSRRSRSPTSRPRRGSGAVLPRGRPDVGRRRLVVVGDHRHLAGGRLGPVRKRHRTCGLADGRVRGVGAGRAQVRDRRLGRRSAGSGNRGRGLASSGGALAATARRRLLGRTRSATALDRRLRLFRAQDAHTLAWAASGGSSSKCRARRSSRQTVCASAALDPRPLAGRSARR